MLLWYGSSSSSMVPGMVGMVVPTKLHQQRRSVFESIKKRNPKAQSSSSDITCSLVVLSYPQPSSYHMRAMPTAHFLFVAEPAVVSSQHLKPLYVGSTTIKPPIVFPYFHKSYMNKSIDAFRGMTMRLFRQRRACFTSASNPHASRIRQHASRAHCYRSRRIEEGTFPNLLGRSQVRHAHGSSRRPPTTEKINTIHKQLFKKNDSAVLERCLYVQSVLPRGEMNAETFQFCLAVIESFASEGQPRIQDVQIAESLLERIWAETACENPDAPSMPVQPYIHVIRGWGLTASSEALEKCWAIWERMENRHRQQPRLQPNPYHNAVEGAVLYACSRTAHPKARLAADSWIRSFEEYAKANNQHLSVKLYNQVILVHAKRSPEEYGAAAAAEDWLVHLSKLHTEGGPAPTTESFNHVIRAWAQSPEALAVKRSKELLNLMLQLQEDHEHVQPNSITFATIIMACVHHGLPEQAEEMWRETLKYFSKKSDTVDLSDCLTATTLAWRKNGSPEAASRIRALVQEACTFNKPGVELTRDSVQVSMYHLLTVLASMDVSQADEQLRKFWHSHITKKSIAPSPRALFFVLESYRHSKLPDRAEMAAELLLEAAELSRTHNDVPLPDKAAFDLVLHIILKDPHSHPETALKVLEAAETNGMASAYSFSLVINQLCRDKTKESALEAFRLLERLHSASLQGLFDVPSKYVGLYSTVLNTLSQVPDRQASEKCEEVFNMIKSSDKFYVSTSLYTSLMFSFRTLGQEGRRKGFAIFKEILELEKDPSARVSLDLNVCRTVLRLFKNTNYKSARVDAAKWSLEVLVTMLRLVLEDGAVDLRPDQECLDICLENMLSSGDVSLIEAGRDLAKKLRRLFANGQLPALPSEEILKRCQGTEKD